MEQEFTPGAERVLREAARWSVRAGASDTEAPAVVLGLLAESECRAAIMLEQQGIDVEAVRDQWPALTRSVDATPPSRFSAEVQASICLAVERLQDCFHPLVLATEHLLLGLASADHETAHWLREQGIDPERLEKEIYAQYGRVPGGMPFDERPLEAPDDAPQDEPRPLPGRETENAVSGGPDPFLPSERIGVLRVIDAAANRTREGLRVVEDYVRFVLDDSHLTQQMKQLRHELTEALKAIPWEERMAARETLADVGTRVSTDSEASRTSTSEVLAANFTRIQESLRSLEEFSKVFGPGIAAHLEQIRYRSYTVHRAVETTASSLIRLGHVRLYVLVDGRTSEGEFRRLVGTLVDANVDAIQLRDKALTDRQLLERARIARDITNSGRTLLIVNDRPDLAALARADGVHVGQEELTVKDARTIVGPKALVGVSTHSIAQARQAVLDGASYVGVGPTYPSQTKDFAGFPGLELLRAVAAEIQLPAFAIGGITRETLPHVVATGVRRVAVCGAVVNAPDPGAAARALRADLEG